MANQISKGGRDSGKEGENAPPLPLYETLVWYRQMFVALLIVLMYQS